MKHWIKLAPLAACLSIGAGLVGLDASASASSPSRATTASTQPTSTRQPSRSADARGSTTPLAVAANSAARPRDWVTKCASAGCVELNVMYCEVMNDGVATVVDGLVWCVTKS